MVLTEKNKESIPKMSIGDFDYELPEERIAQYPVKERDRSKLLLYSGGQISQDLFFNIDKYLPVDSLLVFNNTKVIRARLLFRKGTGAGIEIFCLEPLDPVDYQQSFSSTGPVEWKCIIGNLKKWKQGKLTLPFIYNGKQLELVAEKLSEEGEAWRVRFSWEPGLISFGEIISSAGHIPLPPYVKREDEKEDDIRYQTIYSKIKGSVAAPTAGLHFTPVLLEKIKKAGVQFAELTLHVGAGTFQPVRADDISGHDMHCEHFFITRDLIRTLLSHRGNIIATGTTSVRTLESIYWLGSGLAKGIYKNGNELFADQWDPYLQDQDVPADIALESLLHLFDRRKISSIHASTKIIIVPGYRFRLTDGMITNFHQPRSTLLLLVSAFTGQAWKRIYQFAMDEGFRFLSFGDASLLLR